MMLITVFAYIDGPSRTLHRTGLSVNVMNATGFPRDRYDPDEFSIALANANWSDFKGSVLADLNYGACNLGVLFPDCDSIPVPQGLVVRAEQACKSIRRLDNLVQDACEKDASASTYHEDNFKLRIAYLDIYHDELHIHYFGEVVNTEWDAIFGWDEEDDDWKPKNL